MNKLDALFTLESLMSLQGSAAATLLVPNVLRYLLGPEFAPYQKWAGFVIALGLAYLVAFLAKDKHWTKWVVAFFNGCLIFASAMGINQAAAATAAGATREFLFQTWL